MAKNQSKKPSTSELVSIIQIFAGWIIAIILIVVIYLYSPQLGLWLISDKSSVWFSETATMLQDFLTITLSIIIEALPFLILGIIISALIRRFISTAKLAKIYIIYIRLSVTSLRMWQHARCSQFASARIKARRCCQFFIRRTYPQPDYYYCNNDRFQLSTLHDLVANHLCANNCPTDGFRC